MCTEPRSRSTSALAYGRTIAFEALRVEALGVGGRWLQWQWTWCGLLRFSFVDAVLALELAALCGDASRS